MFVVTGTTNATAGWTAGATVFALLMACIVLADDPAAPPTCSLRLSVEVTPDVPDPSANGFISSLLGNHPGYQLYLLSVVDDTHVILQLRGPGPAENCQAIVDGMSDDGRVQSISIR